MKTKGAAPLSMWVTPRFDSERVLKIAIDYPT